jgi:Flp pilus assembly protein TadG
MRSNRHKGAILVYVTVAIVAFAGLASLAVDLAHVRLVKVKLQFAADTAARNAISGQAGGSATNNAIAAAAQISVDGSPVVIQASDIVQGTWANGTFTANASPANAVKVITSRKASRGNGVSLWWGSLIGKSTCDVTATAVAYGKPTPLAGFIGYAGIFYKNNSFYGSYDSRVTTTPTVATAASSARLGSNTVISGVNNSILQGSAVLGPGASAPTGIVITGSTLYQSTPLPNPSMPTWSPSGSPTDLVVSGTTVLPGGTYWYNSMTITANLSFSGPATIYVNGNILIDANVTAASGSPKDLTIYQYGANSFGDGNYTGMTLVATVLAPSADFVTKNNLTYYGSGIFNTITTKNNANFYYDTTLGPADGSPIISTVQ